MKAGGKILAGFDEKELRAIIRFLSEATAMQDEHRDRILRR